MGREPFLDWAAITAGAPQGSAGFLSPHRAGPCLLTPEGEGGEAAACPAPLRDPRRREQPGPSTRGAKSPGRADAVAARVERRPGGSPAFTRDDSSRPTAAEGERRLRRLSQAPQQRWRTECARRDKLPSSRPTPPQAPACPPAPPPSFR